MGRIQYYLDQSKRHLNKDGPVALTKKLISFLIRRKFFLQFLSESFEYHFVSRFRNIPATVKQIVKNEEISATRILIYASYDQSSKIGEHIVDQLRAFRNEGYQIIFVTTSPTLPAIEYEKIRKIVSICARRRNEGYDFVSYKVGFDLLGCGYSSLNSLVLMNDSCLGPLFDFAPILEKMREASQSVYGITKSEEISEHIQSYFYHFGSSVLRAGITREFFERIRILRSKWGIVRYFEIGNSKLLMKHEITLCALVDPKDPLIKKKMELAGLTEPSRSPLANEWIFLKLSPFYKRSNPSFIDNA